MLELDIDWVPLKIEEDNSNGVPVGPYNLPQYAASVAGDVRRKWTSFFNRRWKTGELSGLANTLFGPLANKCESLHDALVNGLGRCSPSVAFVESLVLDERVLHHEWLQQFSDQIPAFDLRQSGEPYSQQRDHLMHPLAVYYLGRELLRDQWFGGAVKSLLGDISGVTNPGAVLDVAWSLASLSHDLGCRYAWGRDHWHAIGRMYPVCAGQTWSGAVDAPAPCTVDCDLCTPNLSQVCLGWDGGVDPNHPFGKRHGLAVGSELSAYLPAVQATGNADEIVAYRLGCRAVVLHDLPDREVHLEDDPIAFVLRLADELQEFGRLALACEGAGKFAPVDRIPRTELTLARSAAGQLDIDVVFHLDVEVHKTANLSATEFFDIKKRALEKLKVDTANKNLAECIPTGYVWDLGTATLPGGIETHRVAIRLEVPVS